MYFIKKRLYDEFVFNDYLAEKHILGLIKFLRIDQDEIWVIRERYRFIHLFSQSFIEGYRVLFKRLTKLQGVIL